MKTIKTIILITALFHLPCTAELPTRQEVRTSERGEKLFRIATALFQYETDYGDYPPTLFNLVEKKILEEEDLLLANVDGSLSFPDYFPGRTVAGPPEDVLLRIMSADRLYTIVVKVDLSMWAIEEQKKQNKSEQATPRKPSD